MENKIIEEIKDNKKLIFDNIKQESISVYLFLKNEHKKRNIGNNLLFQFIFRSYYRLDNGGLGDKLKERYFVLLSNKQKDLKKILSELYKIPTLNSKNKNTIQFSFATKLIHTLDNNKPIFDTEVSRVILEKVQGKNKRDKIDSYLKIYEGLEGLYTSLLKDGDIKNIIKKFRSKFKVKNNSISAIKVLDFIIWSLGKLKKKK